MIVTLLTDFGTTDYFAGALKGVILSVDQGIRIVDLSHDIPPHDIESAAFLIGAVYREFPPETVHLVVVDPGVGSTRAPIVASADRQFFVGPDNGVFSRILEGGAEVRLIENRKLFREPVTSTFHGRDIFAPTAAALARGFRFIDVGPPHADPVRLPIWRFEGQADGTLRGRVVHIDHFGNCVTSIQPRDLDSAGAVAVQVGEHTIRKFRPFYHESDDLEPFCIWGSAGLLELSVRNGSAARQLGIQRGDAVVVIGAT